LDSRAKIVGALLVLGTFVLYAQVLGHEFIYLDDRTYVTENPAVLGGLSGGGIAWAFTTTYASNWHPLTWLSHMLDCELFGTEAGRHHLTNLLLHCANVCLLFALLFRMTGSLWPSAFVAALFGVHPLHVESVAWVAERKDVLSTFFGFLTLLAYVRYTEAPAARRYVLVAALLALGLLAKPMLVTWPCIMLLFDFWPLGRFATAASPRRRIKDQTAWDGSHGFRPGVILEKTPFFALVALSSALTIYAQGRGGAVVSSSLIPLDARVTNALVSFVGYLEMAFWPVGLAVYYPHSYVAAPASNVVAAVIVLATLTILAIQASRRHPYWIVGWLFYLGTLVPVIGLVQVGSQAMADRYTYVPLIGVFIIIAWGARDVAIRLRTRHVALSVVCGGCLGPLAAVTWVQVGHWRDSTTLFTHALQVTRDNAPVQVFLAQTLYAQGKRREAIAHYSEAARINPHDPATVYNLGLALYLEGDVREAIARFSSLVGRQPQNVAAHFMLGDAYSSLDQLDKAVEHYTAVLRINPNHAPARAKLEAVEAIRRRKGG
jgi:hypothetical protein